MHRILKPPFSPKPFIFLMLPRTGSKMVASGVSSHPNIPYVKHEFVGSEEMFWEHPYCTAPRLQDWMVDDRITRIHVYRENACAGARSSIMMGYMFPDNVQILPKHEVITMAHHRQRWDAEFAEVCEYSISYETLCNNEEATELEKWWLLCEWIGVERRRLPTQVRKDHRVILKNEEEIRCLSV